MKENNKNEVLENIVWGALGVTIGLGIVVVSALIMGVDITQ